MTKARKYSIREWSVITNGRRYRALTWYARDVFDWLWDFAGGAMRSEVLRFDSADSCIAQIQLWDGMPLRFVKKGLSELLKTDMVGHKIDEKMRLEIYVFLAYEMMCRNTPYRNWEKIVTPDGVIMGVAEYEAYRKNAQNNPADGDIEPLQGVETTPPRVDSMPSEGQKKTLRVPAEGQNRGNLTEPN